MICQWCKKPIRGGEETIRTMSMPTDADQKQKTHTIHKRCFEDEHIQELLSQGWREP